MNHSNNNARSSSNIGSNASNYSSSNSTTTSHSNSNSNNNKNSNNSDNDSRNENPNKNRIPIPINSISLQSTSHTIQSELRSVSYMEEIMSDTSSRDVSSMSLLKGDLDLDEDDDEEVEVEEENSNMEDNKNCVASSSSSLVQNKNMVHSNNNADKDTQDNNNEFDLHLPDFEQLMNTYSQRPPKHPSTEGTATDPNIPNNTTATATTTPSTPIMNTTISISTAPSVKSQYYHSTASHFSEGFSEGGGGDGESEYVSTVKSVERVQLSINQYNTIQELQYETGEMNNRFEYFKFSKSSFCVCFQTFFLKF